MTRLQEMLECLCKLLSTTGKKLEFLADVRILIIPWRGALPACCLEVTVG